MSSATTITNTGTANNAMTHAAKIVMTATVDRPTSNTTGCASAAIAARGHAQVRKPTQPL
ncbi:MAG TPA: hypothetical protein VF174_03100 [Micromonosporaceae bacterium]